MRFELIIQPQAEETIIELKRSNSKKLQKVLKTLALMETNLRHPSLNTHKYNAIEGENGEEIFESYVENKTRFQDFLALWHRTRHHHYRCNYPTSLDVVIYMPVKQQKKEFSLRTLFCNYRFEY